jgi:hypothetical protein
MAQCREGASQALKADQLNNNVAVVAPAVCAKIKPGTSIGRMPANVSVIDRATVTAGFANEVEAVNQ